ncbi:hypothetical protein GCM10007338_20190 [Corynebacterium pelargi]|nr:hypothetical protein GCM10007338_20190 [Corynebacterium pelargi]
MCKAPGCSAHRHPAWGYHKDEPFYLVSQQRWHKCGLAGARRGLHYCGVVLRAGSLQFSYDICNR